MPRRGQLPQLAGPARRFTLASVVLTLVLAACTAGPSTRPAIVQRHDAQAPQRQEEPSKGQENALPPLQEAPSSSLDWGSCGERTHQQLAEHDVPDDLPLSCAGIVTESKSSTSPMGGAKRIHLLKAGKGPVPLVVLNDIDGTPGSLHAAQLATRLPDAFLDTFSLIGIDRRGSGLSDPLNCIPDDVRADLLDHDPAEGDVGSLVEAARSAGQRCAIALEGEQGAYDSWHTAADLDQIRRALGVNHLNALARGESSRALLAYAKRYPDAVGRFVLDGVPDPSPDVSTVFDTLAKGTKASLAAFDAECGAECALDGDAGDAVRELAEQLRRKPAYTESGDRVGPGLALRAVRRGLRDPQRWPELAKAIAEAGAGEPDRLAGFVEPLLSGNGTHAPRLGATIATKCNDTTARPPIQRINKLMSQLHEQHPVFSGLAAQRLAWCSPWPPNDKPIALGSVTDVPPIMVTSSAADPVTPEKGTARAASQLPTAVRVSWQGSGHGALRSGCVRDAVGGFLADGTVPTPGTLCPA